VIKQLLDMEWRKMRRYEAAACLRSRLTVAVSSRDRVMLEAEAPGAVIREIPTGVDVGYFRPNGAPRLQANLVFTGSMDWHPNEDAILYFIREMLPAIRHEVPDVTLTVVGRNPGLQLQEAAREAGVQVTGTVDDVRPYVDAASVYVVPLRIGGGTRLKIFEALAMGKAVVSTSVGAEGLPLVDGEHFLCADEPRGFAAAVVELLRNPTHCHDLGEAGRRLTEQRYAWPRIAEEFGTHCEAALG
jgi:glycosyltransferase involved in cell wall biosynthesis